MLLLLLLLIALLLLLLLLFLIASSLTQFVSRILPSYNITHRSSPTPITHHTPVPHPI